MTAALLLQVAAKVTFVLMTALGTTRVMARCSAAARHLVWTFAIVGALVVPAVQLFGPPWSLPVLPEFPVPTAEGTATGQPDETAMPPFAALEDRRAESEGTAVSADDTVTVTPALPVAASVPVDWAQLLVQLWLAGVAILLARLVIGLGRAAWLASRAHPVRDAEWLDAFGDACTSLGVSRPVTLRVSASTSVPMATGFWRPAVLLPSSMRDWSPERRRVVLEHELAHVRRRDCGVQVLAQLAVALHWCSPLAHMAAARLRAEQERACDDLVIEAGTDARTYADHLFEIARAYRASAFPAWAATSMARPSQLEGRVLAILDAGRSRRPPSVAVRAFAALAAAVIVVPVGALQLSEAPPSPEPPGAPVAVVAPVQPPPGVAIATDDLPPPPADASVPQPSAPTDVSESGSSTEDTTEGFRQFKPDFSLSFGKQWLFGGGSASASASATASGSASTSIKQSVTPTVGAWTRTNPEFAAQTAVSDETRRRVADALLAALDDENVEVRREALAALAVMREERAVPGLLKALSDQNAEVRMHALNALAHFDTRTAADAILAAVKDVNPEVRRRAANYLAAISTRFRDEKYMGMFTELLKDSDAYMREAGVVALGRMRVSAAAVPLIQALKDEASDVRQRAAWALGQLGSADAVPALIGLLKDPEADVRRQAAEALGDIADARAVDGLTAALKDADVDVREAVARALGQVARGQRRGGPVSPVSPVPPVTPRAPSVRLDIDTERLREQAERQAADAWARAQRDIERVQRDVERSLRDAVPFVTPVPIPMPAPEPPPIRP